ncbi:MAG TPA: hypothetical protein VGM93_00455, partial [Acidimicrobiales bacterium]
MTMLVLIIIIAAIFVATITAFVVVSRGRGAGPVTLEPPARPHGGGGMPPASPSGGGVAVDEPPPSVEVPPVDLAPVEAPPVRPSFRDRLAKARGTFAGFLGRTKIDPET